MNMFHRLHSLIVLWIALLLRTDAQETQAIALFGDGGNGITGYVKVIDDTVRTQLNLDTDALDVITDRCGSPLTEIPYKLMFEWDHPIDQDKMKQNCLGSFVGPVYDPEATGPCSDPSVPANPGYGDCAVGNLNARFGQMPIPMARTDAYLGISPNTDDFESILFKCPGASGKPLFCAGFQYFTYYTCNPLVVPPPLFGCCQYDLSVIRDDLEGTNCPPPPTAEPTQDPTPSPLDQPIIVTPRPTPYPTPPVRPRCLDNKNTPAYGCKQGWPCWSCYHHSDCCGGLTCIMSGHKKGKCHRPHGGHPHPPRPHHPLPRRPYPYQPYYPYYPHKHHKHGKHHKHHKHGHGKYHVAHYKKHKKYKHKHGRGRGHGRGHKHKHGRGRGRNGGHYHGRYVYRGGGGRRGRVSVNVRVRGHGGRGRGGYRKGGGRHKGGHGRGGRGGGKRGGGKRGGRRGGRAYGDFVNTLDDNLAVSASSEILGDDVGDDYGDYSYDDYAAAADAEVDHDDLDENDAEFAAADGYDDDDDICDDFDYNVCDEYTDDICCDFDDDDDDDEDDQDDDGEYTAFAAKGGQNKKDNGSNDRKRSNDNNNNHKGGKNKRYAAYDEYQQLDDAADDDSGRRIDHIYREYGDDDGDDYGIVYPLDY